MCEHTTGALFTFHNEFDDVDVLLDDESDDIEVHGPFSVQVIYNIPETAGHGSTLVQDDKGTRWEMPKVIYPTLIEAHARFTELVKNEIQAVLDDGTFR